MVLRHRRIRRNMQLHRRLFLVSTPLTPCPSPQAHWSSLIQSTTPIRLYSYIQTQQETSTQTTNTKRSRHTRPRSTDPKKYLLTKSSPIHPMHQKHSANDVTFKRFPSAPIAKPISSGSALNRQNTELSYPPTLTLALPLTLAH